MRTKMKFKVLGSFRIRLYSGTDLSSSQKAAEVTSASLELSRQHEAGKGLSSTAQKSVRFSPHQAKRHADHDSEASPLQKKVFTVLLALNMSSKRSKMC